MADIDHVVELFSKVAEDELERRYRWSCLQMDLAECEARFVAAAEALVEHLDRHRSSLSSSALARLEAVLKARTERDALSRAIANQADEPKESGAW